jgi:hypothetical protein
MQVEAMRDEVHRIVHSADGDTDDLIDELTAWALDHVQRAYGRGHVEGTREACETWERAVDRGLHRLAPG